jgi:hypothetical protein
MNRHQRRAIGKAGGPAQPAKLPLDLSKMFETLTSLEEFARLAEQVKPHLEKLEQTAAALELAQEALAKAEGKNEALRNEMALQREIFLRMFALTRNVSIEEVLSMEATIQEQLSSEISHAATPIGTRNNATETQSA